MNDTSLESLKRIGVVLPAPNTTLEVEFPRVTPPSFSCHFQRFDRLVRSSADSAGGFSSIVENAKTLSSARLLAMGIGYSAGSYIGGFEWDEQLRKEIEQATSCATVTAASSMVDALRSIGAETIAVVSPYSAELNALVRTYFNGTGFEVTEVSGSPPPGPSGEVPLADVEAMVVGLDIGPAQAVLISCTGLRTFAVIEALESRTGLPIVSSNQALLWALAPDADREGFGPGSLFKAPRAP